MNNDEDSFSLFPYESISYESVSSVFSETESENNDVKSKLLETARNNL